MRHQPRKREGIMLAYPFTHKRLMSWPLPWVIQPKLNGDRCRAVFDEEGHVTLYSSTGHIRKSVPHIIKELEGMELKNFELDGELYVHGWTHQAIRSVVSRTVGLHPKHEEMQFHVFDYVSDAKQEERANNLLAIIPMSDLIRWVPTSMCDDETVLELHYQVYLDNKYEGIIIRRSDTPYVRKKTTNMMKLKPRLAGEYQVVGCEEEYTIHGTPKDALGALWLQDEEGHQFKVGTGFTRDQRKTLWERRSELQGLTAKIRFQELSEGGIPLMPSFVGFLDALEVY